MLVAQNPHDVSLPRFSKHVSESTHVENHHVSSRDIAQAWLDKFATVLAAGDASKLSTVFHDDSWWRDHLALDWELHTVHGLSNITTFVSNHLSNVQLKSFELSSDAESFPPSVVSPVEGLDWVQSMFSFKSKIGRGRGFLRLAQGSDGIYKAHMLYTALDALDGYEESIGPKRALGGKNSLEGGIMKGNWFERRQRKLDFIDEDPQVVIIGAGK